MTDVFEKAVAELNLDRSDWQLVKFGDVAIQQKQSIDRENTELRRYVKGEHMYSEDIHLREWGELTDEYLGPAFIRKFEEGDILYGSRRTYLRKVVIAPFEGITSNTTFVIKANEEKIDRRLLPFIMLSEGFTQHSIKNSKGSVNPYVNWKDLSGYEFLLPNLENQAEIVKLLNKVNEVLESNNDLLNKSVALEEVKSQIWLGLRGDLDPEVTWTTKKLIDVAPLQRGFDLPNSELTKGKYPVCYSNGVSNYHESYQVKGPGVCTGRSGTIGNVFYLEGDYWPHNTTLWVTDFKGNHPKYIYYLYSKLHFEKRMTGTGVPTLNRNDIHKFKVQIADHQSQIEISRMIEELELNTLRVKQLRDSTFILQKSIINQVF